MDLAFAGAGGGGGVFFFWGDLDGVGGVPPTAICHPDGGSDADIGSFGGLAKANPQAPQNWAWGERGAPQAGQNLGGAVGFMVTGAVGLTQLCQALG